MFNLLSNAFKYSVGFGNVKLNLKEKDENIIVEVIDNGIIPEEDQPNYLILSLELVILMVFKELGFRIIYY